MRMTIDLPEGTMCAFISYVYNDSDSGLNMAVAQLDTNVIDKARKGGIVEVTGSGETRGAEPEDEANGTG